MTPQARRVHRAHELIQKLQECETEAHEIGLTVTAHKINAAKNQAGWELAGEPEKAREKLVAQP